MGTEVQGNTLEVKDGNVIKWSAEKGNEILDEVFDYRRSQKVWRGSDRHQLQHSESLPRTFFLMRKLEAQFTWQ